MCKKGNGMTDKMRQRILDMHNDFRSLVASGKAKDKLVDNGEGFAPQAANMRKLEYSCKLEEMAAKYAKKCVYGHSSDESRYLEKEKMYAGENLFRTSIVGADRIRALEWVRLSRGENLQATKGWFYELKEVGIGKENNLTRPLWDRYKEGNHMQIGHYTQLAWGDTDKIGCSIENCYGKQKMTYVVCNYLDTCVYAFILASDTLSQIFRIFSGNRVGRLIYKPGKPCSECPNGYKGCENNLCVRK
ncbi:hypothetical protein Y032_0050g2036 [Ancylostoma ceylanicum]|uniref:SCP domain-containing protein n=1 Tax=Ancylostoma ceylanicum TaxID=53326 RepID=A0A016U9Y8_9BILA|nr:hypothetical protein Y032_0050g2036 [Ancylostoma ceylanicum]